MRCCCVTHKYYRNICHDFVQRIL